MSSEQNAGARFVRSMRSIAFAVITFMASSASVMSAEGALESWQQSTSLRLRIDNDLFAVANDDRDYTGGIAASLALTGDSSLVTPERLLGRLAAPRPNAITVRALQFEVLAFSPGDLSASQPQSHDRPYASLWALTGARQRIEQDGTRALYAAFSAGLLGLRLTESAHRALHRASGTELPEGYDHQISRGGEPTARLMLAARRLLTGGGIGRGVDVWTTVSGSVGYVTETSLTLAARGGERGTPWWASNADLAQYGPAPDFGVLPRGAERAIETGVRLAVRGYNTFLQGQFRHSEVRARRSEIEPFVVTGWLGVTFTTASGWRMSYRLNAQSRELDRGPADRVHVWGSVGLVREF